MSAPVYNKAGIGYNTVRKADPYLASRMYEHIGPKPDGIYLDVGCGTGNYLTALTEMGLQFYGIDPSETMLGVARAKNNSATLINAKVEHIPLPNAFFDGAMGNFTMHHWDDKIKGLTQLARVLKPKSRAVFLSFTPEQMHGYWLFHYFPDMMERSTALLPGIDIVEQWLYEAGFNLVETEKYFVQDDLQDQFLYANKHKPENYLIPEVRNGASSFTVFADPREVAAGLMQLSHDIDTGEINDIIARYENDEGDYLFYVAERE